MTERGLPRSGAIRRIGLRFGAIRKPIVLAAMVLVFLGGLGSVARLALSLGRPFAGVAIENRLVPYVYLVSGQTPAHWSGLNAGLKAGDLILCIEGFAPADEKAPYISAAANGDVTCPNGSRHFSEIFRESYRTAGPSATGTFLVSRAGRAIAVSDVPLIRFSGFDLLSLCLPNLLWGLGLLALAVIVYQAAPNAELNLAFSFFATIMAGVAFHRGIEIAVAETQAGVLALEMVLAVPWLPFLGATLFHLSSLLSDQPWPQRFARRILPWYSLLSGLGALIGVYSFAAQDQRLLNRWPSRINSAYLLGSLLIASLWTIAVLLYTYRRTASRRVRRQTGLIMLGLGLTALVFLPFIVYSNSANPPAQLLISIPYVILAFVGIIAYTILRYQLFRARTRILIGLMLAIFCIFVAHATYLLTGARGDFLPILATALIIGGALATRRGPAALFDRLLHREAYDYETVVALSREIARPQPLADLVAAAERILCQGLDLEHADIWLLDEEGQMLERHTDAAAGAGSRLSPDLARVLGLGQALRVADSLQGAGDPAAAILAPLLEGMAPDRVALWVPLADRGQAVGVLGLGPRWTGELFDRRDVELARLLAQRLALAVLTTRQLGRLQSATRLVSEVAENERRRIARELHDTIIQFLAVLTYGLEGMAARAPALSEEVEQWQDRISHEAHALRDLVGYLRAADLLAQGGLGPSLQGWLDQMSDESGLPIVADLAAAADQVLTSEAKLAVYRICREAVHNAIKHSQASHISVRLSVDGDAVRFSVADDGHGFAVTQALQAGPKGYSSLADMRTLIESVGGRLEISSAPGTGARVEGRIPLAAAAQGVAIRADNS